MNIRAVILLLVAVIGMVGVFTLSRSFFSEAQQQAQQPVKKKPTIKILVTKADLPRGTVLQMTDLTWKDWPEAGLSPTYYRQTSAFKPSVLEGKVVRHALPFGAPLTSGALVSQGEKGFMAAILSPGMRAVSVALSPVTGVAGFVFPGDRVDVILTHTIVSAENTKIKIPLSETILRNVRVLGVDQRSENAAGMVGKGKDAKVATTQRAKIYKTATLEVWPKDAEKVSLLTKMGTLNLALRSLGGETEDGAPVQDPKAGYTWSHEVSHFLTEQKEKEKQADTSTVKIIRGSKVSSARVEEARDEEARDQEARDQEGGK